MTPDRPAPPRPLRLLIADDDRDVADSTAALLRASGFADLTVAYGGAQALAQALAMRPDVMLLDLQMPGLGGLQVARRVRQHHAGQAPYLIALTGCADAVHDLSEIDEHFDRALAKPLNLPELIATLQRLALGSGSSGAAASTRVDVAELLTGVVRPLLPVAAQHGLSMSFDHTGPSLLVAADPVLLQCGFHRLLSGLFDIVSDGFALFSVRAALDDTARGRLVVDAAATGTLAAPGAIQAALARLGLQALRDAGDGGGPTPVARGVCSNTGAALHAWIDPAEGVLLRAQLAFEHARQSRMAQAAELNGERAWIVDANPVPLAWGERRLLRQGWQVHRFASCRAALARAGSAATPPARMPALLAVVESPELDAVALQALRAALPASTRCILAVQFGSPLLARAEPPGYSLRIYPFSPLELAGFTELALPAPPSRWDTLSPTTAAGLWSRPQVLLVDDNEVNRIIGRALLEACGCEVRTAHDGLDAIDQCRRLPPQLVLMDVNMPVLGGIEAAARLRRLQREGKVPPFALIAATADHSDHTRAACRQAGMDDFLPKPLDARTLGALLRRYTGGGIGRVGLPPQPLAGGR